MGRSAGGLEQVEGVVYRVKLRRQRGRPVLYFYESSVVVAAASARWESRLLSFLEELGFERVNRGEWATSSSAVFLSGLILCSVAQTMRRPDRLARLRSIVGELELLELRFWGHVFSEAYRRAGRRGMYRPARAFKVLYRLSRR